MSTAKLPRYIPISAGLDYPGIGPEHANLYDTGRPSDVAITDDEAVDAFEYLQNRGNHPGDRKRPCHRMRK